MMIEDIEHHAIAALQALKTGPISWDLIDGGYIDEWQVYAPQDSEFAHLTGRLGEKSPFAQPGDPDRRPIIHTSMLLRIDREQGIARSLKSWHRLGKRAQGITGLSMIDCDLRILDALDYLQDEAAKAGYLATVPDL